MSDDNSITTVPKIDPSLLASSAAASTTPSAAGAGLATGSASVDQAEFLTLLVTQLQNQDPLDPVKNEDFAVQLAQFSQLEQLIDINDKLGTDSASGEGFSSLASYLGHEILFDANEVQVSDGSAGKIQFTLPEDAADVRVELLNDSGGVVEELSLGALSAGEQTPELVGISAAAGSYAVRVTAQSGDGLTLEPEVAVSGVVDGFVPGPEATLLVGEQEVNPAQIREVRAL